MGKHDDAHDRSPAFVHGKRVCAAKRENCFGGNTVDKAWHPQLAACRALACSFISFISWLKCDELVNKCECATRLVSHHQRIPTESRSAYLTSTLLRFMLPTLRRCGG